MTVRIAHEDDLAHIMLAGVEFFGESNWSGLTIAWDRIRQTLINMHNDPEHIVIVAFDDEGCCAGFTFWALQNPWTVEKIAIENLFYVRKQARGTGIATHMIDFAMKVCKDSGAKLLYSSSTAGFGDNGTNARAYNILLKRSGFKEIPKSKFLIHNVDALNG